MNLVHTIRFQDYICPNYKTKPDSGLVFHNWQVLLRRGSVAEQWGYRRSGLSCIGRTAGGGGFAELWMPLWSWQVGLFLCLSQSCQKVLIAVTAFFKIFTSILLCNHKIVVTNWILLTKRLPNRRNSHFHFILWLGSMHYRQWVVRVRDVWPPTSIFVLLSFET